MECKKCKLPVPDGSIYCNHCGEALEGDAFGANLQEPPKQQKEVKSTLPVLALLLSAVSMNMIGMILAAVSLFKFCNFERAELMKEMLSAKKFSASSKKYAVSSIVISVLSIVFIIIFVFLMMMTLVSEPELLDEFSLQ